MEMGQTKNVCFSKNSRQRICEMATVLARLSATGDTPHPDKILQICLKNMKKVNKVKKWAHRAHFFGKSEHDFGRLQESRAETWALPEFAYIYVLYTRKLRHFFTFSLFW